MGIETMMRYAWGGAKLNAFPLYHCRYFSGRETIRLREPNKRTRALTEITSGIYAARAGVSVRVALSHLRKLVADGLLFELPRRRSGVCIFRLQPSDADIIGLQIIDELRARGLPFDDESEIRQ
jgi:hypothetical protein